MAGGPRTSRAMRATPVRSGLNDTRPTLTDRQIDSDTDAQTESDRRTTVLAPALLAEAHAAAACSLLLGAWQPRGPWPHPRVQLLGEQCGVQMLSPPPPPPETAYTTSVSE